MNLLVEYRVLDKLKVINEGTGPTAKTKLRGIFQKCDEQNNNGRIYPRKILENQVQAIQEKIADRSLVGALDHPANDAIHLSQASHLVTKLWVEPNGVVMGECEILSTPNGQIVKALINDGVKIGISSRGLGTVSESRTGKVVNEDFKLITFDLVSDPSTKGAYPELTESIRENSNRAQQIVSKMKKDRILLTVLEQKIDEIIKNKFKVEEWKSAGNVSVAIGKENRAARLKKLADLAKKRGLKGHETMYTAGAEHEKGQPEPTLPTGAAGESAKRIAARNLRRKNAEAAKQRRASGGSPREALLAATDQLITERNKKNKAMKDEWEGGDSPTLKRSKRFERKVSADPSVKSYSAYKDRNEKVGNTPHSYSSWNSLRQNSSTEVFRSPLQVALQERCWKGYKPVEGKKPYSKGSCKKK